MKKIILVLSIITLAFLSGIAFANIRSSHFKKPANMKKVTGIGGVFFKAKDPKKTH